MILNFKKHYFLITYIEYGFHKKEQDSYNNGNDSNCILYFRKSRDYSSLKYLNLENKILNKRNKFNGISKPQELLRQLLLEKTM